MTALGPDGGCKRARHAGTFAGLRHTSLVRFAIPPEVSNRGNHHDLTVVSSIKK